MKKISIQLIVFSLLIFLVSCKTTTNNSQSASNQDSASNVQSSEAAATKLSPQTATPSEPNELGIVPISGVDKSDDKKIAPNIKWTSSDGTSKSLNDYKGKVVMLNFWATWCPPCRAELPDIVKLRNELGPKGFEVIGVSVSERLQPGTTIIQLLSKFMNSNKMSYPMLYLGMD
ncbi:MAG: TlpA disulfide reductase family protein, partial [Candidatus Kapaibacterium sp.]